MVNLTVTQLRNLLQLPERPFEDVYAFDGTSYFDLSHREPCTMLLASGTVSGQAFNFVQGTDYQLTAGCIDWTLPGAHKPDFNTPFTIDYTYSRLGGAAASTSVANAQMIVAQDLGPAYPYGASTTSSISYDQLATYGASLVAARDACYTLADSDIDLSQKARRGSIVLDDSKKTNDWTAAGDKWQSRYRRYLTMIRPGGTPTVFSLIRPTADNLIFGTIEREVFDNLFTVPDSGFPDSGAF